MTQSIEKAISEMKKHPDQVQDAMAGNNCGDQGPPIAGVRAHPLLIHRAARLVASALVAVLFVMTAAQASPNIETISRETPTSEHTNADVLTWKITFSEPVASATHHTKNVDPTDFTVSGTTATLTLTPLELDAEKCSEVWHATLSGGDLADLNGTVTIEPNIIVKDGLDFDGHNPLEKPDIWGCIGYGEEMTNPGPLGQNDNTFVLDNPDNTKPEVTITGVPQRTTSTFTATFTFDETVSGFEAADITVTGGTKGTFAEVTSGRVWTLVVTPSADYSLAVAADVATDDAGNGNVAATASGEYAEPPPTPQVTISAGTSPVTEGTAATFTITANPAPTTSLTVNVNVSETGNVMSGTPPSSVTINANESSTTLTVATDDDQADESNGVVTAEVAAGTGYTVGSSSSASVTVQDNDDPEPPPPSSSSLSAPTVTRALATSMAVNWEPPTGSAISSYDLRYRQSGTTDFIDGPQGVTGTRTIISGLNPDTEYEIQVRASNSTDDGDWSEVGTVRTSTLIPSDRFSFSLDVDDSEGDQFMSFLSVAPDSLVSIQIFGRSLKAIPANDLSVRFEYDSTQVVYEGFKMGPVLSGTSALAGKDLANIGMTLPDSAARVDSGLVGTIRFRATDAISETEIRLVRVELLQGEESETVPMFLSVALQGASLGLLISDPSPDFNGNGTVDTPDFLLFVDVFGLKTGQERYEARYDLDKNDEIGISDFLIFVDNFGKVVPRVPVFTLAPPVTRFVEENTPSGQPIGEPISATSADGEPLTYSLWGVDAAYFAIDASTGQLQTKGTYNFEERNWYSPIVRVSGEKGGRVSIVVGIAIIDVAE